MVLDLSFNNIGSDPSFTTTKQKMEEMEKLKEYARIKAEQEELRKNPKAAKDKKGAKSPEK